VRLGSRTAAWAGIAHLCIVSARAGTFTAANDVQIAPQATLDERADARIVCIPELAIASGLVDAPGPRRD
jgi:hypothetical protein